LKTKNYSKAILVMKKESPFRNFKLNCLEKYKSKYVTGRLVNLSALLFNHQRRREVGRGNGEGKGGGGKG
jgi:hypothetical protein